MPVRIYNIDNELVKDRPVYSQELVSYKRLEQVPELDLAIEFERDIVSGTDYTFVHSLGVPVRWWVVDWGPSPGGAAPVIGPRLVKQTTSDTDTLILTANATGRVVVRVEPSASRGD